MRHCNICKNQIDINWKNEELLSQFMDSQFRILRGRTTGTCAKHQRELAKAIKRARQMGVVPYTSLIQK